MQDAVEIPIPAIPIVVESPKCKPVAARIERRQKPFGFIAVGIIQT
jgi:hypothetical protein